VALHYDDDLAAHERSSAPAWRESYYMNFFDQKSDLHGLAWVGVRPNDERGEMLCALFDGSETLLRAIDFKVPVPRDVGEERRGLGPLKFDPVEPWSHWRLSFDDGSSNLQVDWRQLSEWCDWDWEDLTSSKHYQAAGRVEVKGNVGGREIAFTGTGERDRAWGERDYGFWTFVWWVIAQFEDGDATHVFLIRDHDGNDRLHGHLTRDGRSRPVARYTADVEYEPNGGPPEHVRQVIVDDEGRELVLERNERMHYFAFNADGRQVEDAPAGDMDRGRMFWTFHRWIRDDGAVGRGMIDYVFHAGNQPPRIESSGPIYSSLYDYGLAAGAAR
jgi:hypothetical protein